MIDSIGVVYAETKLNLLGSIWMGAIFEENQIGIWPTMKTKLSCHDLSNWVPFVTKTRQVNNMINHTCAIYVENDIELAWPIRPVVNCDENHIRK